MSIKVTKTNNTFSVKLNNNNQFKITAQSGGVQVPAKFEDLEDFDTTNLSDNYIIMYDASTQKYTPVNPDDILLKAVTEASSPGIPTAFVGQLEVDLENKINLDAGTF
jgi:hypothetical protein